MGISDVLLPLGKVLVLVSFLVPGCLGAQPLTLDQAVDRAMRVNLDYQASLLAVDTAKASVKTMVDWKSIAVTATEKQTSATASTWGVSSTSLGVTLPLFDQLGASASVDQGHNTSLTVTATPLAHSDSAVQSKITYDKAVLAAAQARVTADIAVRKAYLAQVLAEAQLSVQRRKTALLETTYQDVKTRYTKGKVTLTEVRTALQDWTTARGTQTSLERAVEKARGELSSHLQSETVSVVGLTSTELEALVKALDPIDPGIKGVSTAVKTQLLEVEARQAKADATWLVDPGLSITANALVPAQGAATWSGTVTLSLALGDWQGTDKTLANQAAALAQKTLEAQRLNARSGETLALLAIQGANDTLEARQLALVQARELENETGQLARAGKATALDVEEAAVGVASAENDVFAAWSDLYGARLDLVSARS